MSGLDIYNSNSVALPVSQAVVIDSFTPRAFAPLALTADVQVDVGGLATVKCWMSNVSSSGSVVSKVPPESVFAFKETADVMTIGLTGILNTGPRETVKLVCEDSSQGPEAVKRVHLTGVRLNSQVTPSVQRTSGRGVITNRFEPGALSSKPRRTRTQR